MYLCIATRTHIYTACAYRLYIHIYVCTCFILTTTQRCGRDTAQKKKQRRMCSMSVRPTWPALALTFSPPGWKVKSHTRKPETHEQTHLLPSNGGSLSRLKRERMARAARTRPCISTSFSPPAKLSLQRDSKFSLSHIQGFV